MMVFAQPIWLLLAIPLGASLYLWPLPTRWLRISRGMLLALIVLAMAHPAIRLPDRAGTLVVVADRSDSMPPGSSGAQKELINLLHQSMGPRDQLAVVAFGHQAVVERPPQRGEFGGFAAQVGSDNSRLNDGLEAAVGLIPPGSPGRILMLSDGQWTGRDPAAAAARAAERGIALDYRLLARPQVNEISVCQFQTPQTVSPQEAFYLNAWVQSPLEQEVRFELRRGTQVISAGSKKLAAGLNRLMFRDRAHDPGTLAYQLSVTGPENDPFPENNRARALVGVQGARSLLAVAESGADSGLARLLRQGGLQVVARRPDQCRWTLEDISQYSAILLENINATYLGAPGMETLAAWVEQAGTGLMITGGKKSYGPGGYFRSPLERIMPVSMEMRQEHRKNRVAIVVTLDRSGSMAMAAGGGRTKMDLANLGTVQVLDLLSPNDEIGVIAVDSSAHTIVDLNTVGHNQAQRGKILAIDSLGGGIFIFEALSAAAQMLLQAKADTKHIILFADAADSEQPGQYQELLEKCRQANITVSVVGMGTAADIDALLLEDIAKRGQGNIYFSDSPYEIPRLFAQDTFTIARSSFIEESTPVKTLAGMRSLGGQPDWQPPSVGGYNLCYVRPEASLALITTDEYQAPVVAGWQAASGRVLCFTGEADGRFSGPLAQWNAAGEFYTTLARWTAGEPTILPEGMVLTQEIRDGSCHLELHLDPKRDTDAFALAPRVAILHGAPGQTPSKQSQELQWNTADSLEAWIPIRGNETVLATVAIPGLSPLTLSPVCLPYSPEFNPEVSGRGAAALKRLADATGGEQRLDLPKIWRALPSHLRRVSLTPWLIIAAIIGLLVEILQRRTGAFSPRWRLAKTVEPVVQAPKKARPPTTAVPAQPATKSPGPPADAPAPQPAPPPSAAPAETADTLAAMRQARARAKGRQEGR